MRNISEKKNTSEADVIPAIAHFLEHALWQEELRSMPATVQQMFEDLIDTDYGNDIKYLRRILATLRTIRSFSETLEPFTDEQITNACNAVLHE